MFNLQRKLTRLSASVGRAYIRPYSTVKIMHCAVAGSSLEKSAIRTLSLNYINQ